MNFGFWLFACPRAIFQAPDHGVESTPAPHAHWTLYEALQQPMAIARALAFGGESVSEIPGTEYML